MLRRSDRADADITITVIKEHGKKFGYEPIIRNHVLTIYWGFIDGVLQVFQYYNDESEFDPSLYEKSGAFFYDEIPDWHTSNNHAFVTKININSSLKMKTMANFFRDFSNVIEINGLENLNTEEVTDFDSTFRNCSSIVELNLDTFNTTSATTMAYMFDNCISLEHIYVKDSIWSTDSVVSSTYMFRDNYFLNNYNGIEDKTYAIVDNGENNGYLEPTYEITDLKWGIDSENHFLEFSEEIDPESFFTTGIIEVSYRRTDAKINRDIEDSILDLQEGEE